MPQNHYFPRPIALGKNSKAIWSFVPDGTLLVFVHGFNGHPTNSWGNFQAIVMTDDAFKNTDILFYGYNSLHVRARPSGKKFYDCMQAFLTDPLRYINANSDAAPTRHPPFQYDRVYIIAHSLGAVISRQALLDRISIAGSWPQETGTIFFAPAHLGANIIQLIGQTVSLLPPIALLANVIEHHWQVLQDLREGSQHLAYLRASTRDLFDRDPSLVNPAIRSLVARAIVLAENDHIVNPNQFERDPPPDVGEDVNHVDVCKPERFKRAPDILAKMAIGAT